MMFSPGEGQVLQGTARFESSIPDGPDRPEARKMKIKILIYLYRQRARIFSFEIVVCMYTP